MTDKIEVLNVIFKAVDEFNEVLAEQTLEKSSETVLFGASGQLDSLGLVNFILMTEQQLEDDLGMMVALADERAMSQKNSPFRTIDTLADYVMMLITGETNA